MRRCLGVCYSYCVPSTLIGLVFLIAFPHLCSFTSVSKFDCPENDSSKFYKYSKEANVQSQIYLEEIQKALLQYQPCVKDQCNCHYQLITRDLFPYRDGIVKEDIDRSRPRGTLYQVIGHNLFRETECMFPSRCSGIEHFLLKILHRLPDLEFVLNTRDWPQVPKQFAMKGPVFSFSKTNDYLDITYPAWTFWEGGPAITIYPTGIGHWTNHRKSLMEAADAWSWDKKIKKAFFRGSRTSSERDPLIYLSRDKPDLVDAQYTKNQAWKSDEDTLYAPPATEVLLEDHCQYKYLFNYRGVAASFRLKHLFLCKSLVFHVGQEWIEFFYPQLKPWVHYIPVPAGATKEELEKLLTFAMENDDVVKEISKRGYEFIKNHLRNKDILCYWKKLLLSYSKLLQYQPKKQKGLIQIKEKGS